MCANGERVTLALLRSNKPMKKGLSESFFRILRDESLNLHWPANLSDARNELSVGPV